MRGEIVLSSLTPSPAEYAEIVPLLGEKVWAGVSQWCDAIGQVMAMESDRMGDRIQALATTMAVSRSTAQRKYLEVRDGREQDGVFYRGWQALIDWRRVRLAEDSAAIPAATVTWWRQIFEKYKGRRNCRKRAWNDVCNVAKLRIHRIPGYESRGGYPEMSASGHPVGWGYRNFCRYMPNAFEVTTNIQGRSAAAAHRPLVLTSRVGLECGQVLMFDDVWHDFKVKTTLTGKALRLRELCCMDLFSGKRVLHGVKPEQETEDGSKIGLRGADMRFLLAAVLSLHGYRRDGTTLIGEHGTAVIEDKIRDVLSKISGGKISVADSAIEDKPALLGWYSSRHRGNFRIKAALESRFNLVHNLTAMLPGQTGSNARLNAPEELHGRQEIDKQLSDALKKLELPPERAALLRWPWLPYQQAIELLEAIYDHVDARTDHALEGWEKCGLLEGEFRMDDRAAHWYSARMIETRPPEEQAALSTFLARPECFRARRLSPTEVWQRGCGNLVRLPWSVLPQILGPDLAIERKVNERGMFTFLDSSLDAEPVHYLAFAESIHGDKISLDYGEKYSTFVNPFAPQWLLCCDATGRIIGRCERVQRVCKTDLEALHRAMGKAAHVEKVLTTPYRARHVGEVEQLTDDAAWNKGVLAGKPITPKEIETAERIAAQTGDLADIYPDRPKYDQPNNDDDLVAETADMDAMFAPKESL
jgi:hypothetical protein